MVKVQLSINVSFEIKDRLNKKKKYIIYYLPGRTKIVDAKFLKPGIPPVTAVRRYFNEVLCD